MEGGTRQYVKMEGDFKSVGEAGKRVPHKLYGEAGGL